MRIKLYGIVAFLIISPTYAMTEVQKFTEIAASYEQQLLQYSPELGLFWGKDDIILDKFTDVSWSATKDWQKQEDQYLQALNELDSQEFQKTSVYPTFLLLKETLINSQASRICQETWWDINPAFGWHNRLATVAAQQPVGTAKLRAQALKRWQSFADYVDKQIINLELGLKHGYTAPKSAVKRVLTQLQLLIDAPIEQSPYYDFAKRDGDSEFKQQVRGLIETSINPALQKYRDFLQQQYLPKARTAIGVSNLPQGSRCYQAKLRQENSLDKTAAEIHQIGIEALAKLAVEIKTIGKKLYQSEDIPFIFKTAREESQGYFNSEASLLAYHQQSLERIKAVIPNWFMTIPITPGIIKPYPAHRAKTGASGEYQPPNITNSQPGIFYLNTFEPEKRSRIDLEATLFHELIPGHHFQIALMDENKDLPELNHYLFSAGFVEGWALYVERLADEMGMYQDEISRLGMLSNESLRAARLVVDTGIHAFGWSRAKAIKYLQQNTALSDAIIAGEVDRYTMMPGQATAYLLGKIEIERLRQRSREVLQKDFDIRLFHQEVLKHGMLSLPVLDWCVEKWLGKC